jgi:predicted O-methyltransferase YrrM
MSNVQVPDAPWMHPNEINLILMFLHPDHSMLEWGCGGSTVLFSKYVKEYYSIEHNKEWHSQVTQKISDSKLDNIKFIHVPTDDGIEKDFLPETEGQNLTHKERYNTYIKYPHKFNVKFDRILIDGRARQFCIDECLSLLKDDGLVFFHDFWMNGRDRYRNAALRNFDEVASIIHSHQSLAVLKNKNIIYQ